MICPLQMQGWMPSYLSTANALHIDTACACLGSRCAWWVQVYSNVENGGAPGGRCASATSYAIPFADPAWEPPETAP